jgi:hypothetical protein
MTAEVGGPVSGRGKYIFGHGGGSLTWAINANIIRIQIIVPKGATIQIEDFEIVRITKAESPNLEGSIDNIYEGYLNERVTNILDDIREILRESGVDDATTQLILDRILKVAGHAEAGKHDVQGKRRVGVAAKLIRAAEEVGGVDGKRARGRPRISTEYLEKVASGAIDESPEARAKALQTLARRQYRALQKKSK